MTNPQPLPPTPTLLIPPTQECFAMTHREKRAPRSGDAQRLMPWAGASNCTTAPLAPHAHASSTSRAAARRIRPDAGRLERLVLETLRAAGPHGMTDAELQEFLGLDGSTQRPRRVRLIELGLVVDSGRRGRTASGRRAVVWIGREFAGDEEAAA